jgi:opacity protein-like surface antigen
MRSLRKLCLMTLLLPLTSHANGTYLQADLMLITVEAKPEFLSGTFDADPTGVALRLGNYFNRYFALEGMFAFGLADDTFENSNLDVEVSNMLGVYGVGAFPVSNQFSIFGKAGFVSITYEDSDGDEIDGDGLSYGVGASFNISDKLAIVAEYIIFPETKYDPAIFGGSNVPADSDTINIGFQSKF